MEMVKEFENPYRPYDLESGDWFYHEDVIKQIKEIFEAPSEKKVVVLQGHPGSGKTSLLKRIAKTSWLLGENYIPIYLDSRNYMELDATDFVSSVSEDIIDILNKLGYEISIPRDIKRRLIKNNTIESLLLLFDSIIKSDDIIILIFDEIDDLLENIDHQIICDYIKYIKQIEKTWNNYGLILAADKRLSNLTNNEIIKQFFNTAPNIDIEDFVEEETIKRLIVEPVRHQLTYNDDVINRIIWYSGKNLYFQQLICHNLVNYLNEKQRTHCSLKDLEETVKRILSEEMREFTFGWDTKISTETRLIASALADRRITEKTKGFYYIKENTLLDYIFGKDLYKKIALLQDFGYISKIKGRGFAGHPFKIPLYGMWIQNEHPFIKTIIHHIDSIAEKIPFETLVLEIEKTPENKLLPFDKVKIAEISRKWFKSKQSILKMQSSTAKINIEDFLISFSNLLNLNIKDNFQSDGHYYVIDIINLNIGILDETFCFFQDRPDLTEDDITNIENIATAFAQDNHAPTKLTIFFYFKRSDMVENLVKKPYLNLITIQENDLKKIILANRPEVSFKKFILSRLSLDKVSPYRTAGPAKATFYGRIDIINQILSSPPNSYAIVGSRKIGKTSLLYKIKDTPRPNTIYIFLNLEIEFSNVKNYRTFLRSLEEEIKLVFVNEVDSSSPIFDKGLSKLSKIIQQLSSGNKKIIFIFDEIDCLIEFDKKHNYKLMRIFRTMVQKDICQFIFAGFKELYHQKRDINHPAYNFYEEIRLQPLAREAALDLITKPMNNIGVHYENEKDRELILKYTACHPNLLQFFCKNLVKKIEKHENTEDRRTILKEDIEKLFDDEYEDYIMDQVYMFFSDLSEIDKLILLLLAEQPLPTILFSAEQIKDLMMGYDIRISIKEVHRHLKNLVMRFILLDKWKDKYCFALPAFPEMLKKRTDIDHERIIEEIKKKELKFLWKNLKIALAQTLKKKFSRR